MYHILLSFLLAVGVNACSVSRATIEGRPPGISSTQAQLDDLSCANASQKDIPIFGWVLAGAQQSAYVECLRQKGYLVKE